MYYVMCGFNAFIIHLIRTLYYSSFVFLTQEDILNDTLNELFQHKQEFDHKQTMNNSSEKLNPNQTDIYESNLHIALPYTEAIQPTIQQLSLLIHQRRRHCLSF
eukprot:921317_1